MNETVGSSTEPLPDDAETTDLVPAGQRLAPIGEYLKERFRLPPEYNVVSETDVGFNIELPLYPGEKPSVGGQRRIDVQYYGSTNILDIQHASCHAMHELCKVLEQLREQNTWDAIAGLTVNVAGNPHAPN